MYKIGEGITKYLDKQLKDAKNLKNIHMTAISASILGVFGSDFKELINYLIFDYDLYDEALESINNLNVKKFVSLIEDAKYKLNGSDYSYTERLISTIKDLIDVNNSFVGALEYEYDTVINLLEYAKEFKNKLDNYKDKKNNNLRLYGYASDFIKYYTIVVERKESVKQLYKAIMEPKGLEKCKKYVKAFNENVVSILTNFKNKVNKEVMYSKELYALILTAAKISEFALMPISLSNSKACNTIASYYENGRVDNDKEAINLYFAELQREEALKIMDEKYKKALEEERNQINQVITLINKSMNDQKNAMISMAKMVSDENKKHVIKYNELVDEYNDLVNEYNDTLDEIEKIKEDL